MPVFCDTFFFLKFLLSNREINLFENIIAFI